MPVMAMASFLPCKPFWALGFRRFRVEFRGVRGFRFFQGQLQKPRVDV